VSETTGVLLLFAFDILKSWRTN